MEIKTRDNLEVKKVEISMKNPETYQIMRFSRIKSYNHNLLKKEQYIGNFMPRQTSFVKLKKSQKVFLFYRWLSFFEKMRQKNIDKIQLNSYSVYGSF